ncbi:uncharacterized protein [Zea mays]|uniref:uncharacterized protein n=1 Tax=Zea mays TaxID=4577 RepID=UPI001651C721|nr:uncharacterized protein LOC109939422 [Zea mays]
MDPACVSEGDNSKNLHKIDVTVNSYFAVLDGKKVYNRGRTINLVVNPEHYTLIDLEKDVDSYFKWGSCQKPIFWVVEKGDKWQCKLTSDAQLSDLVSSFDLVKLFMTMGRCKEGEETLHVVTDVVGKEMATAANVDKVKEMLAVVADVVSKDMLAAAYPVGKEMDVDNIVYEEMHVDEVIGTTDNGEEGMHEDMDKQPEWREVPEYGQTTAGAPVAQEEEKEHFMTAGCDPDGDEPIGANEEWRYFKFVDGKNVQPVNPVDVQTRRRARAIPEFDLESVPDDEAGLVDDYVVPHTTYDHENPVIKEGDTFEDKAEFLKTIRTYAIKNEFETKIVHSDRERYRARCKDVSCEWKIFAKKLHGGNTFMVLLLPYFQILRPCLGVLYLIFTSLFLLHFFRWSNFQIWTCTLVVVQLQ